MQEKPVILTKDEMNAGLRNMEGTYFGKKFEFHEDSSVDAVWYETSELTEEEEQIVHLYLLSNWYDLSPELKKQNGNGE